MTFDFEEKLLCEQAAQRFKELEALPEKILRRFDKNGDGKLSDKEKQAALASLRHEIRAEKEQLESVSSEKFTMEETLEDRYRVVSEIGSGTQSNVYLARDLSTQSLVVLKQMRVSDLDRWEALDSFKREAEILKEMSHPKIPAVIDFFIWEQNNTTSFISVQSYLLGQNLEQLIDQGQLFNGTDLLSIARQVLQILIHLHGSSPAVLHRDIKPSNLLLDVAGNLSLIDFGVGQYVSRSKTIAMGTTGYMAPEQLVGRAIPQSDLYSLGVCLIRLATRKKPETFGLCNSRLDWRDASSLSEGFSNWIDRLIDPESEDRFSNAREAIGFLDKLDKVMVNFEPKRSVDHIDDSDLVEVKTSIKNPNFRIWKSPDLFVCTVGHQRSEGFLARLDIAFLRVSTGSHRAAFEKYGSGISLTADGILEIRCGDWKVNQYELKTLVKGTYSDGKNALFDEFNAPVLRTLDGNELDRVWKALITFCKLNGIKVNTR